MSSGLLKFLSLLLAFVLGFLACAGGLVLGGVFIYNRVSYETLQDWGLPLPATDAYLDSHADVRLTALTLAQLVEEIGKVMEYSDELTLDLLVKRYGVKLTDDTRAYLPPAMMEISLRMLASQEGFDYITNNTTMAYVFGLLPEDILSEPAKDALINKTLADLMAFDFGYIFSDMKLGYLTGITYEKDAEGEYQIVYADPNAPTKEELLAPLSIGPLLDAKLNGGDTWGVVKQDIGDVPLEELMGSSGNNLSDAITKDRTLGDVIIYNEATGMHDVSVDALVDDLLIGDVVGWTAVRDEEDDSVILYWEDEAGEKATGIMTAFADMTVNDLSDEDKVQAAVDNLYLYETLGFKQTDDGYVDRTGDEVTGILAVLAPERVGDLDSCIGSVYIGEIMGWTPVYEDPDAEEPVILYWEDEDGERATGIMASFANLTIDEMSDETRVQEVINELYLYDVLSYTEQDDGTFIDSNGDPVTGIMGALAGCRVSELDARISELTLADVFEEDELQTGFLSLLDPDTRLYGADGEPGLPEAVSDAFSDAAIGEALVGEEGSAELVTLDAETQMALTLMDAENGLGEGTYYYLKGDAYVGPFDHYWKTLRMEEVISYLATGRMPRAAVTTAP